MTYDEKIQLKYPVFCKLEKFKNINKLDKMLGLIKKPVVAEKQTFEISLDDYSIGANNTTKTTNENPQPPSVDEEILLKGYLRAWEGRKYY